MKPRVWAPLAQRMEIEHDGRREAMQPHADGWWIAATDLPHGADYAFCRDGGEARPDPRSLWQPNGVHAPSRCFDVRRFVWSDADFRAAALTGAGPGVAAPRHPLDARPSRGPWTPQPGLRVWRSAVLYELHIGTFTAEGRFDAAIGELDHLAALGITHVEVMPIAAFPGERGWGYDGVALFAAHSAYGGPEGFQRFVDACHARGLGVILDVVYNHLGPSGNYLSTFAPYFTDRHHTPWGEAVNFDGPYSDGVREFFIANARSWLRDFHCDGLRLDAVHAIADNSARTFLEDLAASVRVLEAECGRPLVLIAESDANDSRLSAPPEAGGIGLTAQWNEDFHHALHAALSGEREGYFCDFGSLAALAATLRRGFYLDGRYSHFRHRRHGRPFGATDASRLVVYAQNHDQTGNRARGERLSQLVSPGLLRVAAALTLLGPGVPLLFQGEEFGAKTPFLYFTDHAEPELAAAVRQGRPRESPDPQDPDTFTRSRLRWDQQDAGLLAWYRDLIRLRRTTALAGHDLAEVRVRYSERDRWLTLARGGWRVACNLAPQPQAVPLGRSPQGWRLVLASAEPQAVAADAATLAPTSAAVFAPRQGWGPGAPGPAGAEAGRPA
ncbi:MAG: malto-oligosyltrehalose trehalohydrolase [Acidobacteria bacterium]|nr:MAG: malto-oligosyltrehalose trehalohydrolase [Acidobacteriota bacterium]